MKWFTFMWWKYLFKDCKSPIQFLCRINNHKCGVVWYNLYGNEPDMHCRNCGEDLG